MTTHLLECPFCAGGDAVAQKVPASTQAAEWPWIVICNNCGARTDNCANQFIANQMWNLRKEKY